NSSCKGNGLLVRSSCSVLDRGQGVGPRGHGTTCLRALRPLDFLPSLTERDDLSSDRHLALIYCWSMIPRVEPEGMLPRKPAPTPDQVRGRLFRDHALGSALQP